MRLSQSLATHCYETRLSGKINVRRLDSVTEINCCRMENPKLKRENCLDSFLSVQLLYTFNVLRIALYH